MEKNTLQSLFEAVGDDEIGDVSDFEQPGVKPEDAWQFADPEKVMSEDYAIDMVADMLVDGDGISASDYFEAIGKALVQYSDSLDMEKGICDAVRAVARQQLLDIYEGETEENSIKPVSNAEIVRDLAYLFKQLITMLQVSAGR
jgi:hypothetical protein